MLVFKRGEWVTVDTSIFSDPALSFGQLQYAAAIIADELARGASQQKAVMTAETRMYERIYPELRVSREEHCAPENEKKDGRV
jgi:hypothetical protein